MNSLLSFKEIGDTRYLALRDASDIDVLIHPHDPEDAPDDALLHLEPMSGADQIILNQESAIVLIGLLVNFVAGKDLV